MRPIPTLLVCFLLLTPAADLRAQSLQEVDYLDDAELELRRYSPDYVNTGALYETLQAMYGRDLVFRDRRVDNLFTIDDSLVIYETAGRMERILRAIEQLDLIAEDEYSAPDESAGAYTLEEMSLQSYMPRYMQASELYQLADDLYGDQHLVGDAYQDNLRLLQRSILVYDRAQAAQELLEKLADLDRSQAPEPDAQLEVHEYQPRHLSSDGLMQGLQPFRAAVNDYQNGQYSQTTNLTLMQERGTILVRDYAERASQILAALARLDRPAPQVMVTCQVLRGIDHAAERPASAELQRQLSQLLPHEAYEVEATGMLRGSAVSGNGMELEMESFSAAATQFQLKMLVGSFDEESGALGLETCQFSMQGPQTGRRNLFATSTTVYRGEQAVLGVAGAEPLFLVVQIHPVGAVTAH